MDLVEASLFSIDDCIKVLKNLLFIKNSILFSEITLIRDLSSYLFSAKNGKYKAISSMLMVEFGVLKIIMKWSKGFYICTIDFLIPRKPINLFVVTSGETAWFVSFLLRKLVRKPFGTIANRCICHRLFIFTRCWIDLTWNKSHETHVCLLCSHLTQSDITRMSIFIVTTWNDIMLSRYVLLFIT